LDDAVADLRKRENTGTKQIGFVNVPDGTARCQAHPPLLPPIRQWTAQRGFDGLVWTDLPPNFHKETDHAFSIEQAKDYLIHLPKSAANRARQYINNAPPEVDTPLRRAMHQIGWLFLGEA
jgi:hypothetical protein